MELKFVSAVEVKDGAVVFESHQSGSVIIENQLPQPITNGFESHQSGIEIPFVRSDIQQSFMFESHQSGIEI